MEFDGWHIDQIGDIRPAYNNEHVNVKLDSAFTPFLQHIKADLKAPLVMNAVNQYGQKNIANSDVVEFLYTEVWDPHVTFQDLVNVIRKNDEFSNHKLSTVLAAYMNYEKSDEKGVFNTPGILLADAVIFASGAAHLELGEHMLVHEYFPNDNREMSAELTNNLVRYYDFMTAYQSLLRDSRETVFLESINSETHLLSREPEQGKIWISQRETDDYQLVHLINFTSMKTMQWRDPQGTCPEPELLENIELDIHQDIGDVYILTPDIEDLRPQKISSNNGKVVVPSLKYWTTIIITRNS
jgi:dextranase